MVNVISLGIGSMLPMAFRRAHVWGIEARHLSPFSDCRWSDFDAAFRKPVDRSSVLSMATDLRCMQLGGDPVVFSPTSSLEFQSLRSLPGAPDGQMSPLDWVAFCRNLFVSRTLAAFDAMESGEPVVFMLHHDPPAGSKDVTIALQKMYGRLACHLLKAAGRAKRSFYFMTSTSSSEHITRYAPRFFVAPCPVAGVVTEDSIFVSMPRIASVLQHFGESAYGT